MHGTVQGSSSSGQDSAVDLHLKYMGHSFEDSNACILTIEDRWFTRVKKPIYTKQEQPYCNLTKEVVYITTYQSLRMQSWHPWHNLTSTEIKFLGLTASWLELNEPLTLKDKHLQEPPNSTFGKNMIWMTENPYRYLKHSFNHPNYCFMSEKKLNKTVGYH